VVLDGCTNVEEKCLKSRVKSALINLRYYKCGQPVEDVLVDSFGKAVIYYGVVYSRLLVLVDKAQSISQYLIRFLKIARIQYVMARA
jgi:hypothetical protein